MRKYMSKRQRPCDFCRSRKTACRIDHAPPCRSCQLHARQCTFLETPRPRKRPIQSPDASNSRPASPPIQDTLDWTNGASNFNNLSEGSLVQQPAAVERLPSHGPPTEAEALGMLSSGEMNMQFLDDIDLDGSEYHFMFRTPRSPSLAAQHHPTASLDSAGAPSEVMLDNTYLHPETLGFSGDMAPFLLQRYRLDGNGTFKFKQLSVQAVQSTPLPMCFLASHPSLFAPSQKEAGHELVPENELREELEQVISINHGKRLIALYQRFIAPQYPIFCNGRLPDPTSAPPPLLAALYAITFPFARYDEQLCIDLAYDSPPSEALARIIDANIAADLHSPNLALVQLLLLIVARPSAVPHVSDASYRWSTLGTLVSAAVNIGLHLDPSCWNILPWQVSQRRRISFTIYALDKWLSGSLGRPPHITDSNWLVTSLEAKDKPFSGLSDVQWSELMEYSSLTAILSSTLTSLYSLQAIHKHLQEPEACIAVADSLLGHPYMNRFGSQSPEPELSPPSMLRTVLCLGYHHTILLIVRASIQPFLNVSRESPRFRERQGKMQQVTTSFCSYLASLKTDEVDGFWPPWCQAAFSSLCFSQLLMATAASTLDEATLWVEMLQQTRKQLRTKSGFLPMLRLGLLRIDSIFWRGADKVLNLEAHVSEAFRNAQRG